MNDDPGSDPTFDAEAVYDAQISPLMAQIIDVCKANGIPMFATFCYRSDDENGLDFCTSAVPRGEWQPQPIMDAYDAIYRTRPELVAFTITKRRPERRWVRRERRRYP